MQVGDRPMKFSQDVETKVEVFISETDERMKMIHVFSLMNELSHHSNAETSSR